MIDIFIGMFILLEVERNANVRVVSRSHYLDPPQHTKKLGFLFNFC